jgi:alpha-tubulin suppressor-like RCC1 family protein
LAPQLGDVNRPVQVVQPVEVARFVAVAAGGYHSLALDDTGRIWSWGNNDIGQLGIGVMTPNEPSPVPMMVDMPEGVTAFTAIAAGTNHSAALDQAGRAWAWGDGETVGQGSYLGDQPAPLLVATPVGEPTFNAITARQGNTFALDQDGRAWGWGGNSSDVLGIHPFATAYTPVPILMPVDDDGAVIPYSAITGGGSLVLALDGGGTAWAWGSNLYGELGNGSTDTQSSGPVEVTKDPSVSFVSVAAGGNHALALDADGRVWAWGLATHGELGNGDTDTNRATPVLVTLPLGVTSFSGIAAGTHYSLALDEIGAMWAWGRGEQGMRGDGTFEYARALPVPVLAP